MKTKLEESTCLVLIEGIFWTSGTTRGKEASMPMNMWHNLMSIE